MPKQYFEQFLLEAVDESLGSLGESSREAIYFHLDRGFKIKKQDIPDKVEGFTQALESIFGLGAGFLEILMTEKLYEKVKRYSKTCSPQNLRFKEYVTLAKREFSKKREKTESPIEAIECAQKPIEI